MIQKIQIIICLLLIVALNPFGDAIRDNGKKRVQKTIEIFRDLTFLYLLYLVSGELTFVICGGLAALCYRISIHNLIYNIKRNLPWYYVGTTSLSDDIEANIDRKTIIINRTASFIFGSFMLFLALRSL